MWHYLYLIYRYTCEWLIISNKILVLQEIHAIKILKIWNRGKGKEKWLLKLIIFCILSSLYLHIFIQLQSLCIWIYPDICIYVNFMLIFVFVFVLLVFLYYSHEWMSRSFCNDFFNIGHLWVFPIFCCHKYHNSKHCLSHGLFRTLSYSSGFKNRIALPNCIYQLTMLLTNEMCILLHSR